MNERESETLRLRPYPQPASGPTIRRPLHGPDVGLEAVPMHDFSEEDNVTSHREPETHSPRASHKVHETQSSNASQGKVEAHITSASHVIGGNQDSNASQAKLENQGPYASQLRDEIQSQRASQLEAIQHVAQNYEEVQKVRMAVANRETAMAYLKGVAPETMKRADHPYSDDLERIEKGYLGYMEKLLRGMPVYDEFLSRIRGIGPRLSCGLVGIIGDISRFGSVSSLWHYAGLHVVDGVAARRTKGEKMDFSPTLKTLCWNVGESLIRSGGYYKAFYDGEKPRELKKHKEQGCRAGAKCSEKAHVHARTKRKMVKLFLSHLWEAWRQLENLPTPKPYVAEYLGHAIIPWTDAVRHDASQFGHVTQAIRASQQGRETQGAVASHVVDENQSIPASQPTKPRRKKR